MPVLGGIEVGVSDDTSEVGQGVPSFSEGTLLATGSLKTHVGGCPAPVDVGCETADDGRVWIVRVRVAVDETVMAGEWDVVDGGGVDDEGGGVAGGEDEDEDEDEEGEGLSALAGPEVGGEGVVAATMSSLDAEGTAGDGVPRAEDFVVAVAVRGWG
ncbi:hypothetical protein CH63R_02437 [Colletotrichum higginsianum IMI 349063]|uniref:Uncharacterized protein n=1 Tax=Colletotrichum higginsianum (strain IMI 349063) TaxID=759273 RepID=A0A1B7YNS7_COLHI|nr:hypothetical protein CH63R_02437 [Colletotrichum higginsianum IMI 349063]OBR13711.1 hypothetical protein CH63R_02437 [Colletotrichum higginsianum IMI 349063]